MCVFSDYSFLGPDFLNLMIPDPNHIWNMCVFNNCSNLSFPGPTGLTDLVDAIKRATNSTSFPRNAKKFLFLVSDFIITKNSDTFSDAVAEAKSLDWNVRPFCHSIFYLILITLRYRERSFKRQWYEQDIIHTDDHMVNSIWRFNE